MEGLDFTLVRGCGTDRLGRRTSMRGEEKPDEPSGPSESGISRIRLLALNPGIRDTREAGWTNAAVGTIRQSVLGKMSGKDYNSPSEKRLSGLGADGRRRGIFGQQKIDRNQGQNCAKVSRCRWIRRWKPDLLN